ncbi:MAG: glycosyltransferase family 4 protein [Chlorobium sp.]|nr:glycosyltransferase family 4 protein [Chlorobium sp.]
MNILYLNHYAGSPLHGMEYRPYYLSREWVRSGHAVRILGGSFSHVRSKQPSINGSVITRPTTEWIDGIEYTWYPTPPYQGNGWGRVVNISAFLRQVWLDSKRIVAAFKPDVVIASSTYPLDIWVARHLARLAKGQLVFEVHDLWPLSPIELGGMSPRHPFIQLCQRAENTAYRDADLIVSMLPKVHDHMAAHGLNLDKLHIIPNGISPEDWQGKTQPITGDLADYIKVVHAQGQLLVGYTGAHGIPNALDALLDAAILLKNQPIHFVLVGDGHEKPRLLQRVQSEELNNVKMFPPIPKGQIPALLYELDITYIGLKNEPLFRFGVSPNKLMDYMMAAKPILFSIFAGNDPVTEAACGLTVPAASPQAIAKGLLKLTCSSDAERKTMGNNGRAYVQAHHVYPVLAQKFISIIGGRQ